MSSRNSPRGRCCVVISAGNEGTVVSSPGNCPGVAAVAAIRHAGSKVGFSSLGPEVTIAAPGGNCVNINGGPCLFSLDTTSNNGTTAPGAHTYTDQINSNLGTSFSAPIVSGIAGADALAQCEPVDRADARAAARRRAALPHRGRRRADHPGLPRARQRPGYPARAVPVHHEHLRRRHGECRQFASRRPIGPIAAVALSGRMSPPGRTSR